MRGIKYSSQDISSQRLETETQQHGHRVRYVTSVKQLTWQSGSKMCELPVPLCS